MGSIQKVIAFGKSLGRGDAAVALIIVLVATASFGLGRLSVNAGKGYTVHIENPDLSAAALVGQKSTVDPGAPPAQVASEGEVVASKSGSTYHLPWCPGAAQIKEENKVWFATPQAAQAAGYRPAKNCKGL